MTISNGLTEARWWILIHTKCEECGERALLKDTRWNGETHRFEQVFECPQGHQGFKERDEWPGDRLELMKRVNRKLGSLSAKPASSGDDWFLGRVLRLIKDKHHDEIYMDRFIQKHVLYLEFSQWFHFTREETRKVLDMLASRYEDITFSNRGLWIDKRHLRKASESPSGGGRSEVVG